MSVSLSWTFVSTSASFPGCLFTNIYTDSTPRRAALINLAVMSASLGRLSHCSLSLSKLFCILAAPLSVMSYYFWVNFQRSRCFSRTVRRLTAASNQNNRKTPAKTKAPARKQIWSGRDRFSLNTSSKRSHLCLMACY